MGKQMPEQELLFYEVHDVFLVYVWDILFVFDYLCLLFMFPGIYLYRAILILCVIDLFTVYEW